MTDWKENLAYRIAVGFRPSSVPALSDHQAQTMIDEIMNGASLDEASSAISKEYVRHAIAVRRANSPAVRLLGDTLLETEKDEEELNRLVLDRLHDSVSDINLVYIAALKTAVMISVPVSASEDDDVPEFVFETNFKTILDALEEVRSSINLSDDLLVTISGTCLKVRSDLMVRTEVAHDLSSFVPRVVTGQEINEVGYLAAEIPGDAPLSLGSIIVQGAKR